MSPPLVSFSLRLPSRLASALHNLSDAPPICLSTKPVDGDSATAVPPTPPHPEPRAGRPFVVSLLTREHETLATTFSQARSEHENMIQDETQWESDTLGLPLVKGALGGMECEVVWSLPLKQGMDASTLSQDAVTSAENVAKDGKPEDQGSMLFVARVNRVARGDESSKALLYEKQGYVTTGSST